MLTGGATTQTLYYTKTAVVLGLQTAKMGCFPSTNRQEDEFQLTPLGPLPGTTRRDAVNRKVKQNLSSSCRRQAPPRPSAPKPYYPRRRPSQDLQDLVGDDGDALYRMLMSQAAMPRDASYSENNRAAVAPPPPAPVSDWGVKFEHPRSAPTPPPPPPACGGAEGYGRSLTTRHKHASSSSSRKARDSGSSSRSKKLPDVHPSVASDPWYQKHAIAGPPPAQQRQSRDREQQQRPRHQSSESSRPSVSALLGLKESEKAKQQRLEAERARDREARKSAEELAKKIQRGREREREREWHTAKQVKLQGLEAPEAQAGPSRSQEQPRSGRTRVERSRTRN